MCYSTPRRYWERVCWYKTRIFLCDKPTYGTYQLAAKFQPSTVSPCSANELVTTYAYGRIESHSDQILTGADLACFVICVFDWDTILLTKSFIYTMLCQFSQHQKGPKKELDQKNRRCWGFFRTSSWSTCALKKNGCRFLWKWSKLTNTYFSDGLNATKDDTTSPINWDRTSLVKPGVGVA